MKIIDVTINRIDRLTAQSVKLTFNTAHLPEFRYKAGQYVTLCLTIQGEEYRRAYSICSSPSDENVAVAVKEVEGGKVSTHVNRHLMPGAAVRLMVPQGHFVFTPDATKKRHIVLFGAGSGVTPLLSIAKAVLEGEPNSTVTLFYGNSSKDSIMFYSELDEMAADPRLKVYHILSDGSQQEPLFSGRINFGKTSELLYNFTNDGLNKEYYICGPAPMMQGVKEALLDNGIASDCIHMEYFEAPAAPKEPVQASNESMPASGEAQMLVELDGQTYSFTLSGTGKSILDSVIKEGGDAPFSCRGGVCTTCMAKVLEGEVRMDSNLALTDGEIQEGFILTCQAHPVSGKVRITYDF